MIPTTVVGTSHTNRVVGEIDVTVVAYVAQRQFHARVCHDWWQRDLQKSAKDVS